MSVRIVTLDNSRLWMGGTHGTHGILRYQISWY